MSCRPLPLLLTLAACALLQASAQQPCADPVKCDPSVSYFPEVKAQYAQTVSELNIANTNVDFKVTAVSGDQFLYRLVRCGCKPGKVPAGAQVIYVPPRRVYVEDGPTLGMIVHELESRDLVGGVKTASTVYDPEIRRKFAKGMTYPQLKAANNIDVAFVNSYGVADFKNASVGKPYFVNGELAEETPFGRAEWVKFLGLILNKAAIANVKMDRIVKNYNQIKWQASKSKRRPSVLVGYPVMGRWSQPSQKQYTMQLLRDAHADHVFMNDGGNSTNSLPLNELVEKFRWSRYLINSGPFPPVRETDMSTLFPKAGDGAAETTKALKSLAAVRCANVWVLNKRLQGEGSETANDYFEWASTNPDTVLADLIHILHPNIDVGSEPFFSQKLKDAPANVKGGECPYNDLFGKAKNGMVYVDTSMTVQNRTRFEIENALVGRIIPEVAKVEGIDSKMVDGFFEDAHDGSAKSTNFTLRTMVPNGEKDAIINETDTVVTAVSRALGNATVQKIEVGTAQGADVVNETPKNSGGGISGGAVAAIVFGMLVLAGVIATILYCVGKKRGHGDGEAATQEHFWENHGLRVEDPPTRDVSIASASVQDRSGVLSL